MSARPWLLTNRARRALREVSLWTLENFGARQADIYEEELIGQISAIAEGTAFSRSCGPLIGMATSEDVRFLRCGGHFIIFLDRPDKVVIFDIVHARSDLPRKLGWLGLR